VDDAFFHAKVVYPFSKYAETIKKFGKQAERDISPVIYLVGN
jgi:hypothetical protein